MLIRGWLLEPMTAAVGNDADQRVWDLVRTPSRLTAFAGFAAVCLTAFAGVAATCLTAFAGVAAICLSMSSWMMSILDRASAHTYGSRITVNWLSCRDSPPADQLVEPVTTSTPSMITIFRCIIADFSLWPIAMLLPIRSLCHDASRARSAAPEAWVESRLICTKIFSSSSFGVAGRERRGLVLVECR